MPKNNFFLQTYVALTDIQVALRSTFIVWCSYAKQKLDDVESLHRPEIEGCWWVKQLSACGLWRQEHLLTSCLPASNSQGAVFNVLLSSVVIRQGVSHQRRCLL